MNEFKIGDLVVAIRNGALLGKRGVVVNIKPDNKIVVRLEGQEKTVTRAASSFKLDDVELFLPRKGGMAFFRREDGTVTAKDVVRINRTVERILLTDGRNDEYNFSLEDYLGGVNSQDYIHFDYTGKAAIYPFALGIKLPESILSGSAYLCYDNIIKDVILVSKGDLFNLSWVDLSKLKRYVVKEPVKDLNAEFLSAMADANEFCQTKGLCFSVVFGDDKTGMIRSELQTGAACHWNVKYQNEDGDRLLGVVQFITNKYRWDNRVSEYLEWVMNSSPWADCIETKDLDHAVKYGIKVKPYLPANQMMCTLYALRYPTEYMEVVNRWYDLVNNKECNPNAAFFLAETNYGANESFGHHKLLDTQYMNMDSLYRFINCKEGLLPDKPYGVDGYWNYKHVSRYHGVELGVDLGKKGTAIAFLNDTFEGTVETENHPILGEIKHEIPAIDQIIEHLNGLAE